MKIFDFLKQLNEFFPINESENKMNNRFKLYGEIIQGEIQKKGKDYDFKKVIQHLVKNYKYKTFPSMPEILDALPYGEKLPTYNPSVNEGCLLVVTLPSGYTYEFTVSSIGKPIKQLEEDIKRKFGDCTYKLYPKGTVIIQGKVFYPEEEKKEGEKGNVTTAQSMATSA